MLTYTRKVKIDSIGGADPVVNDIADHIRAELSAMADPADNPDARAADVQVFAYTDGDQPGVLMVEGTLDAQADAPYLKDGYQAFADVPDELLAEVYNDTDQPGGAQ